MYIHNIDLHYHAGQERAEGITIGDHLQHARMTGRKVLGVTDHLGLYLNPKKPGRHYQTSVEGLQAYRRDLDGYKDEYADLTIYFAPEIGPGQKLADIPDAVIEVSDFFIGEAAFPGDDINANTDAIISRMTELREFADTVGKELFLAHPFRSAVNRRLIKHDPEPSTWTMAPLWDCQFSIDEIKEFFMLDLKPIAETATGYRIPLEVNGNTQFRIRSSNLQAPLQMLWRAYGYFWEQGVDLVPGSDQHGFMAGIGRVGGAVPADCFHYLGIEVDDISFLQRIRNPSPAVFSA